MNQSRLFDPFTKNHGSFIPLLVLMATTSIISIATIEFINHIAFRQAKSNMEKRNNSPLKSILRNE